jgi:hypothetical protein
MGAARRGRSFINTMLYGLTYRVSASATCMIFIFLVSAKSKPEKLSSQIPAEQTTNTAAT